MLGKFLGSRTISWGCRNYERLVNLPIYINQTNKQTNTFKKKINNPVQRTKKKREISG